MNANGKKTYRKKQISRHIKDDLENSCNDSDEEISAKESIDV